VIANLIANLIAKSPGRTHFEFVILRIEMTKNLNLIDSSLYPEHEDQTLRYTQGDKVKGLRMTEKTSE